MILLSVPLKQNHGTTRAMVSVHSLSGHEDALLHLLCRAASLWFSLDHVNITMGRTRNREAASLGNRDPAPSRGGSPAAKYLERRQDEYFILCQLLR